MEREKGREKLKLKGKITAIRGDDQLWLIKWNKAIDKTRMSWFIGLAIHKCLVILQISIIGKLLNCSGFKWWWEKITRFTQTSSKGFL